MREDEVKELVKSAILDGGITSAGVTLMLLQRLRPFAARLTADEMLDQVETFCRQHWRALEREGGEAPDGLIARMQALGVALPVEN